MTNENRFLFYLYIQNNQSGTFTIDTMLQRRLVGDELAKNSFGIII